MSQFLYYQRTPEGPWLEALSSQREQLSRDGKTCFITALDLSAPLSESSTREEIAAVRYSGPFYTDFDAAEIATSLEKYQQFLIKLRDEYEINLASVRLYATGKKGFHCEIPMEVFMPKIAKGGLTGLPAIYKEMAFSMYVDTMDLRVYTARKGRMWRTCGVKRENGNYKVPLTTAEALEMAPEDYASLAAAPRPAPVYAKPELSPKLAVLFEKSKLKIEAAAKRKKDSAKDLRLLADFKGDYPPTLARIMRGEGVAESAGFQQLAMQIAITSNALMKSEEQMLEAAIGLIENHQSDGSRYNSPAKRMVELVRMHRYTNDNVCYEYSAGAVKKLSAPDIPTPDLSGIPEGAQEADADDGGLSQGVFLADTGIWVKTEDRPKRLSAVAFSNLCLLRDVDSGEDRGIEAAVAVRGTARGRHMLSLEVFQSKQKFHQFCLLRGGTMMGTDNQVGAVFELLANQAHENGGVMYTTQREGLDLIQRPTETDEKMDLIWVSPDGVIKADPDNPIEYVLRGKYNVNGTFKSDLMDAPALSNLPNAKRVVAALLRVNEPYVVGSLLGWMTSCFHAALYHRLYDQFPLCQVYGAAGSGKSTTVGVFSRLHYYLSKPLITQCASTPFSIEVAMQSSASMPCILEEYKPRGMRPDKHQRILSMLRSAYNAQDLSKGGGSGELGSSWRETRSLAFASPTIFVGEALETETATLERCVVVPLSKNGMGRPSDIELVQANRNVLSALGKGLVELTFTTNTDDFKRFFDERHAEMRAAAFQKSNHRPVYNLAVALAGLDTLGMLLQMEFGSVFDEEVKVLRTAMLDPTRLVEFSVLSEAAKTLNTLAFISHTEDPMSEYGLRYGLDYAFNETGDLEVKVRNCYVKLAAWSKRKGMQPLYDNDEAFDHGLASFAALIDRACVGSPLKGGTAAKVFRFSASKLADEKVGSFKGA